VPLPITVESIIAARLYALDRPGKALLPDAAAWGKWVVRCLGRCFRACYVNGAEPALGSGSAGVLASGESIDNGW
jgi:hypothetical protein